MTDNTSKPDQIPQAQINVSDPSNAPFIYFEGVANIGHNNNVMNLTLACNRHLMKDGVSASDIIAIAHLRCNVIAAIELRDAIDKALLLGAKTEGKAN